jgi:hypothetical protein
MKAAERNLVDCLAARERYSFVREPNERLFTFEDIREFRVQIITTDR